MSERAVKVGLTQWTLLLGGPATWWLHFCLVYGAASLEMTLAPAAGATSRVAIVVVTLIALALVALTTWRAPAVSPPREGGLRRFWVTGTRLLCLISAVSIVYQALPALLVP